MNENLKAIFDSYENEKTKIRKRIDANKELVKKLDNQINSYYSGCISIMDKVNARKENKPAILELEKRLAAAYETEIILTTSLKVANEMKLKAVANALRDEIINNPEKWTKYPLHFQKSKNMVDDFLNGTNLFLSNYCSAGTYYLKGLSRYYDDISAYMFTVSGGIITQEVIEEMKRKQGYNIIPASDILTECKKAFKARKKIIEKYENARKEIENLRTPFSSCNAFYYILPYANNTPENYKRL